MSLEVDEVLDHHRSKYQDVLVFKSKNHGTVFVLDGVIQVCIVFVIFSTLCHTTVLVSWYLARLYSWHSLALTTHTASIPPIPS